MAISNEDTVVLDFLGGVDYHGILKGIATNVTPGTSADVVWENGNKSTTVPVGRLLTLSDPSDIATAISQFFNKAVRIRTPNGIGAQELMGIILDAFLGTSDSGAVTTAFVTLALIDRYNGSTGHVITIDLGDISPSTDIVPSLQAIAVVLPDAQAPRY